MNRAAALARSETRSLLALANNGPAWAECLNAWLQSGYPYAVVIAKDGGGPALLIAADAAGLVAAAEFACHALSGDECEWLISEATGEHVNAIVLDNLTAKGNA